MAKVLIVGSGFSAALAQAKFNRFNPEVMSVCAGFNPRSFITRRPSLEYNKIASSETAKSFGTLNFDIPGTKFHDRLILGGNSSIWGGFLDSNNMSLKKKSLLESLGVRLTPLSFESTGSISNRKSVVQMQNYKSEIYNASCYVKPNISGYLYRICKDKNRIRADFLTPSGINTLVVDRLILCIGFVQLIDLIYRSFPLDGKLIQVDEFAHSLSPKVCSTPNRFDLLNKKDLLIRYNFSRALQHAFGVQKRLFRIPFIDNFLYVDQVFRDKLLTEEFYVKNGNFLLRGSPPASLDGGSIHYCNLRIDNISVVDYVKSYCKGVDVIGMSSISQREPGPISNNILNQVFDMS